MIVLTVAHGERYVRRFFDYCLPSLMTPRNLPSVRDEALELRITTVERDVPLVRDLVAANAAARSLFNDRISVNVIAGIEPIEKASRKYATALVNSSGLLGSIEYCLQKDASFLMAVPDLLYADGCVATCRTLHALTGKVVAIFNGRINPRDAQPDFTFADLHAAMKKPLGLRDLFFDNMSGEWKDSTTSDLTKLPSENPGHLIYDGADGCWVFCSIPNPFLGRFTVDDLLIFASGRGFRAWDHDWSERLWQTERLVIQPNLDLGMSVEPDPNSVYEAKKKEAQSSNAPPLNVHDQIVAKYRGQHMDAVRRYKFAGPLGRFCFTTLRNAARSQ